MAQTYTKMWEAFFGGEFKGGDPLGPDTSDAAYLAQTRDFYKEIIGPAFLGEDTTFGETDLGGWYASFDPLKFEQAEEIFRSSIGDPYGTDDPFAWEKVSRYDTEGGDESRIQKLLESELYGQGKFLGGETGAEYGLETSRTLEDYTTGLRGEREALSYEGLQGGGPVLRSSARAEVAEDVLIEAYKKAKTLGAGYKEGKEGVERTLETDLNEALGTYLSTINTEKERWFRDVMRNVSTYSQLEMDEDLSGLNDTQIAAKLSHLSGYEFDDKLGMEEWGCGYGQEWDPAMKDDQGNVVGGCTDTAAYTRERYGDVRRDQEFAPGYEFRETDACGIGMIWNPALNEGKGGCEVRTDLDLSLDSYGLLCKETTECWDGTMVCNPEDCGTDPSTIDLGCGPGEPKASFACPGGSVACKEEDCPYVEDDCAGVAGGTAVEDECGVCDGPGADIECNDGSLVCNEADCPVEQITCWNGDLVDNISQCPHQSCVETGCAEYGPQYTCDEFSGYCQDPSTFKNKDRRPTGEDVDCDAIFPGEGRIWDGMDCVFPDRIDLEDNDIGPGGTVWCNGVFCLPNEYCSGSPGECKSEDVEDPDPPPGEGPKGPGFGGPVTGR